MSAAFSRHTAISLFTNVEKMRDLADIHPTSPADIEAIETVLAFLERAVLS